MPRGGVSDGPVSHAAATSAAMSQQATRHARRIYVGGLPPSANEQNVQAFFSNALAAVGGTTAGPGMSVVNVYLNYEKKFAFVEFRTGAEVVCGRALRLGVCLPPSGCPPPTYSIHRLPPKHPSPNSGGGVQRDGTGRPDV